MTCSKPLILLDFKKHRIRVHKNTLHALGDPDYVLLLVNPEERLIALLKSDRTNALSHYIPWNAFPDRKSYEIHSTLLFDKLKFLSNWDDHQAYRIFGSVNEDQDIVQFRIDDSFQYARVPTLNRGECNATDVRTTAD
jgi:hypothetical protein